MKGYIEVCSDRWGPSIETALNQYAVGQATFFVCEALLQLFSFSPFFAASLLLLYIVQYPLWKGVQEHFNSHEQGNTLISKCCILFLEIKTCCSP